MPRFVLQVLSNPVPGREDEYNRWYSEQHLSDVLRVPGFQSAQRFRLAAGEGLDPRWRYLALYEFESDDPRRAIDELTAVAGTPAMVLSEAMDMQSYSVLPWEAITERKSRATS